VVLLTVLGVSGMAILYARAVQARDELEATLVGSLLQPIGRQEQRFDPVEVASFTRLATLPGDRTRLRFLETALSGSDSSRRAGLCADVIVQSVVGLDRGRKAQAERLLAERIHTDDPEVRKTCAYLAASLGPEDVQLAGEAAVILREELVALVLFDGEETGREVQALTARTAALRGLAGRLDEKDAAETAGRLLDVSMKGNSPPVSFTFWLGAPEASGDRAGLLDELMGKLSENEADKLARRLLKRLEAEPHNRHYLVRLLNVLAARLSQAQAQTLCDAATGCILQARGKGEPALDQLLEGPGVGLAAWMSPAKAREAAGQVLEEISRMGSDNWYPLGNLVTTVDVLAGRLGEKEAENIRAAAVRHALEYLAKQKNGHDWQAVGYLTRRVGPLVEHLGEKEAGELARLALESMRGQSDPCLGALTNILVALSGRLEQTAAAKLCAAAAVRALDGISNTVTSGDIPGLSSEWPAARGIEALSGRLAEKDADELGHRVLQVIKDTRQPWFWEKLTPLLGTLAARLNQAKAEKLCAAAAEHIMEVASESRPWRWNGLGEALGRLSGWLSEKEADELARRILEALRKGPAVAEQNHIDDVSNWSGAFKALSGRLSQGGAREAANRVLAVIGNTTDLPRRARLAEALEAVAGPLGPAEAERLCATAAEDVLKAIKDLNAESYDLYDLTRILVALAKHLGKKESARLCAAATRHVLSTMGKFGLDDRIGAPSWPSLRGIAGLAELLDEKDAVEVADRLLRAHDKIVQSDSLGEDDAVLALCARMGEKEATEFAGRALTYLHMGNRIPSEPWIVKGILPRLGQQGLVNLLKSPFCTDGVREMLLAELGQRTGRTFRSRWDFVDWATVNRPDLDLTSPYRPPED
jgi:hypothetical protein